jgi:RNA polymerase sigma-70 factor (ECF subfamily)
MNSSAGQESSSSRSAAAFANTRWSMIVAAAGTNARVPLTDLCVRYWYPVYATVRRHGHPPAVAQDLTLAYFHQLVEQRLRAADPRAYGRFREFVRVELKRFLKQEPPASIGGPATDGLGSPLPIEILEDRFLAENRDSDSPDDAFDRGFAHDVISHALERLRREAEQAGRAAMHEALEPYLSAELPTASCDEISAALGTRPLALSMALQRLRQRFRELVNEELAQTVTTESEMESERQMLRRRLSD